MLIIFFSKINFELFFISPCGRDINVHVFFFAQVIFNSKRIADGAFAIHKGQVTAFRMNPDLMSGSDADDDNVIILDDLDLPEEYRNIEEREISERSLPSSFE